MFKTCHSKLFMVGVPNLSGQRNILCMSNSATEYSSFLLLRSPSANTSDNFLYQPETGCLV